MCSKNLPDTNMSLMVAHWHILYQVAAFVLVATLLRDDWSNLVGTLIKEDIP